MLSPMMLCEYLNAGGSSVFLQGRHVLALNTTLTRCVRSQPSLRPAAAIPDWGCLALLKRWGEPLSALSNDTNAVCSRISRSWMNTQAAFHVHILWRAEQNVRLWKQRMVFVSLFIQVGFSWYACVHLYGSREVCVSAGVNVHFNATGGKAQRLREDRIS